MAAENLEVLPFEIIAHVGTARSMYVEAVHEAREGHIDEARKMLEEGEKIFVDGHDSHLKIFTNELTADDMKYMPLILHAEDQLMSAETMHTLCEEIIDLYEDLKKLRGAAA